LVCLSLGGILLCFMAVYLLALLAPAMPLWVCFLIVGAIVAALGAGLTYSAWNEFRTVTADQSVKALEENLEWKTKPH
jgi:uncharacterized protein YacL